MKCLYCQEACILYTDVTGKLMRWECESCGSSFRTLTDGSMVSISWKRITINNKQYFIKFYPGVTGNAPEFVISYLVTIPEGKQYWKEVKRFDFIPESWTPQNVEQKLKTFLPFL